MRAVKAWWYGLGIRTRTRVIDYPLAATVAASLTWLLIEALSA